MSERRTPLKPSRVPSPESRKGAAKRAREFRDRSKAKYPGRVWPDSTEAIREDRESH